jgi:hypothetical protein
MTELLAKDYEALNEDIRNVVDHVGTFLGRKKETKRFSYYHYVVILEDVGNSMDDLEFKAGGGLIHTTWRVDAELYDSDEYDRDDSGKFEDRNYPVVFQYLLANFAELDKGRVAGYFTGCFSSAKELIEDDKEEKEACYSFCVGNSGVKLSSIVARFRKDGIIGRKSSEYDYWLDTETNSVSFYKIPQNYWYQ